jgi:hypothetical protein
MVLSASGNNQRNSKIEESKESPYGMPSQNQNHLSPYRHTVKDAGVENAIFEELLEKRREEQEHTMEHFHGEKGQDTYPMIGALVNTWEELCLGLIKQHDFLDKRLLSESLNNVQVGGGN